MEAELIMGEKSCGKRRREETLRLTSYTAYWETVVPIVAVGGINVAGIEVQVVGISGTINRTGPVVAVVTEIVNRSIVHVAGPHKPQGDFRAALATIPRRK